MNFIFKHGERYCPQLVGLLAFWIHLHFFPKWVPAEMKDLLANTITLSGVAVGFLATGQVLLCSLTDNFVVKSLRDCGRFEEMLHLFTWAIFFCLTLSLFSLLGYAFDLKSLLEQMPWLMSIWIGFWSATVAATIRVLVIFSMTLHK